jgi:hypothetical protein
MFALGQAAWRRPPEKASIVCYILRRELGKTGVQSTRWPEISPNARSGSQFIINKDVTMKNLLYSLLCWLLFGLPVLAAVTLTSPVIADVLLIEEVRHVESMDVPLNGMTKNEVQARFGEPTRRHAAIGDPPITRWEYERWSAYFEYDRVLFTALHHGEVIKKAGP